MQKGAWSIRPNLGRLPRDSKDLLDGEVAQPCQIREYVSRFVWLWFCGLMTLSLGELCVIASAPWNDECFNGDRNDKEKEYRQE